MLTLQNAIAAAFAHVSKVSGIEIEDREMLLCARNISPFVTDGGTYTVQRNAENAVVQYHHADCVNDGFVTYVFVTDDDRITWDN